MSKQQKIWIAVGVVVLVAVVGYFAVGRDVLRKRQVKPISFEQQNAETPTGPANVGDVSPISGVACANWNKRPFAAMQPVDRQARPVAGFSQAEMVFELPNPAEGIFVTRLMGVYLCEVPNEIGSLRSGRHDYMHLAKGLDAVFLSWGGSSFAIDKLNEGVIDNIDCNNEGGKRGNAYCFRKSGFTRTEDSGYIKGEKLIEAARDFGFRTEGKFAGYLHRAESPLEQRGKGGHLEVGFPASLKVDYDYDREQNAYLRTWGGEIDVDRNNGKRIAPKNVVVMIAENEQILTDFPYAERGVQNPWAGEHAGPKQSGPGNISGRYNNIQLGDPWFDTKEEGEAFYYIEGKQMKGKWKKSKASMDSKLFFYDDTGKEVAFIPGLIWVEVLVPGQKLEWTPTT